MPVPVQDPKWKALPAGPLTVIQVFAPDGREYKVVGQNQFATEAEALKLERWLVGTPVVRRPK
jgi:hypothetical protein